MNHRLAYFKEILRRSEDALVNHPEMIPLEWVIDQLTYLIQLESGQTDDCSKLDKIKLGWIAVREMDGFEDDDLIQSLCQISEEAHLMLVERGLAKTNTGKKQ